MADEITRAAELAHAEQWAHDAMTGTVPQHLAVLLAEYDRRGTELERAASELAVRRLRDLTAERAALARQHAADVAADPLSTELERRQALLAAEQGVWEPDRRREQRVDVYIRTRNVLREGIRTEVVADNVILDWETDHHGVERLAGVEVLFARGVEVDGLDVKTGRPHGVGPAVGGAGTATPPDPRDDLRSLRRAAVDVLDEIDRTGQLGEDDPEVGCLRDALSGAVGHVEMPHSGDQVPQSAAAKRWLSRILDIVNSHEGSDPAGAMEEIHAVCMDEIHGPGPEEGTLTVPRELLESMHDPTRCWFDHHGGCQAHDFTLDPGETCPQAQIGTLLSGGEQ